MPDEFWQMNFASNWATLRKIATLETTCFGLLPLWWLLLGGRAGYHCGIICRKFRARMVALFSPLLRRNIAVLLAVVCLAACATGAQVRMGPVAKMLKPQPDLCGAAALIDVVGHPFTLLADHQLAGPLRILWPGQEITDEVVPNRLNAEVTNDQLILRLSCG